jgi:multidrug efflux system outer membrane protein
LAPSAERRRTSKNSSPFFGKNRTANQFSVPLDYSYEIDLWGKVRQAFKSGQLEASAQQYAYDTVFLTLVSEVAHQYFLLRQLDAQVYALNETVKLRQDVVRLLQERYDAGLSSNLNLSQSKTELARVQAQIIEADRLRARSENALGLLCGMAPTDFRIEEITEHKVQIPDIAAGIPSDLLRRRPDIKQAEDLMAAANAKVGIAKADFYPSINLNGQAGWQSMESTDLFKSDSGMWFVGPSIYIPLFNGGMNKAKLKAARAEYEMKLAQYRQSLLKAFTEVEDALVDVHMQAKSYEAQKKLLEASLDTRNMSYERYRQGLESFIDVVDAERSRLESQLELIQAQTQRLIASVNLIKALGGHTLNSPS